MHGFPCLCPRLVLAVNVMQTIQQQAALTAAATIWRGRQQRKRGRGGREGVVVAFARRGAVGSPSDLFELSALPLSLRLHLAPHTPVQHRMLPLYASGVLFPAPFPRCP